MTVVRETEAGLARDTALMSDVLDDVLDEQAGRDLRRPRAVAAPHRGGACARATSAAAERLVAYLHGSRTSSVEPIIRACSLQLQLANIAEERERVRRRRQYDATGDAPARVAGRDGRAAARATAIDGARAGAQLQVELVLTAHPTEATRRSVLDHQCDVAALLDRLDDPRTGHSRAPRAAATSCARS